MVAAAGPLTWDHCVETVPVGRPSSVIVPVSVTLLVGSVIAVLSAEMETTGGWLVPAGFTVTLTEPVPVS